MVVTEGNPLNDLEALRGIYMVVARGKLIKDPELDKFDQVDKEIDRVTSDIRKDTELHETLERQLESLPEDENAVRERIDRR